MLDDFIKKADKFQKTIEIIENGELPYYLLSEQLTDALENESFYVIEHLIDRVFAKLDDLLESGDLCYSNFFKYENALNAISAAKTNVKEVQYIISKKQRGFVNRCFVSKHIESYKDEYKELTTIFKRDDAFLFFILRVDSIMKTLSTKKEITEDDRFSFDLAIINDIIALHELGEINDIYVLNINDHQKMPELWRILENFLQKKTKKYNVDWESKYILGESYFKKHIAKRNDDYIEWTKEPKQENTNMQESKDLKHYIECGKIETNPNIEIQRCIQQYQLTFTHNIDEPVQYYLPDF